MARQIVAILMALSITAIGLVGTSAPAHAVQAFNNASVADAGLAELGTSRPTGWNQPGECIKSVQRWVAAAGGYFGPGGVVSGYVNSGAQEISLSSATKGDVVQYTNGNASVANTDWSYVHTVVIITNHSNGRFDIVQSNSPAGSGLVTRVNNWTPSPHAGWVARVWRFGTVQATPPPASPPLLGKSFQGDNFSDLAILHQVSNGGFDAHVLYGSTGTPFQYNPTFAQQFPATSGWDWSKIKTSSGDYNGDGYVDIAAVHQLTDGGADVHVLWGGSGIPFTYPTTFVRRLPASDGWDWSKMILESGKFQADTFSDLVILHQSSDGGFDAHVLYGSAGTPFQYNATFARQFPSVDGWDWSKIKTSSGDYNGDGFTDVAVALQQTDGGADVHVLWGGSGIPFTYPTTFVRHLLSSDGWDWSKMKLTSGKFQADQYADLAILRQASDGGFDAHVLYGSTGTPFQYNPTFARQFPATSGWDWSKIKIAAGDYNSDNFDDVAVVHQIGDGGADVHVLWGGSGIPFTYPTTFVRHLPSNEGWSWDAMKLEASQ